MALDDATLVTVTFHVFGDWEQQVKAVAGAEAAEALVAMAENFIRDTYAVELEGVAVLRGRQPGDDTTSRESPPAGRRDPEIELAIIRRREKEKARRLNVERALERHAEASRRWREVLRL